MSVQNAAADQQNPLHAQQNDGTDITENTAVGSADPVADPVVQPASPRRRPELKHRDSVAMLRGNRTLQPENGYLGKVEERRRKPGQSGNVSRGVLRRNSSFTEGAQRSVTKSITFADEKRGHPLHKTSFSNQLHYSEDAEIEERGPRSCCVLS